MVGVMIDTVPDDDQNSNPRQDQMLLRNSIILVDR